MSSRMIAAISAEGAEHENTTTEGSIARHIFPANSMSPGKVYEFTCAIIVNDNNSTDTLTPAVRFGSSATVTSNTAVASLAAVDVADADVGGVHGFIHVHSATRAVIEVYGAETDATGTITAKYFLAVPTFDSTVAQYLDVTLDWSVAHADNEAAAAAFAVFERT